MKKYLNQLIEDIHKAAENLPAKPYLEISEDEECLRGCMEYESTKPKPMQEWFGIDKKNFPTAEMLSKDEIKLMIKEIIELWHAYNFVPDLPEDVPDDLVYKALVNKFDEPVKWISEGCCHIEFCDYDEDNCPFPGYCNLCKEFQDEDRTKNKVNNNINPEDILPSKEEIEKFIFNQKKENIKNIIKEHKISENNIPGIFNYCDRWCERCPFTSRCTNYSLGKELNFENKDLSNKEFWENMSALFAANYEIISEIIQENEIELNDEIDDIVIDRKQKDRPLFKLADEYAINIHEWFNENSSRIEKIISRMNDNKNIVTLHDAMEVIQWYCFFIPAKLCRALSGYDKNAQDTEITYDNNGSAKIALIAVDRSIEAFSVLITNIKENQNDFLYFISILLKIKKLTERTFPNARSFIRPGFDE
ncbi:MAG: hypothetical protein J7J86_04545 [Bacteroidales bacterium]|nr:hypothetical protein [Bacteroidales bacterium]